MRFMKSKMTQKPSPLQIDIISDPICPWCFIGKRKLDAALVKLSDISINLIWRPFQLNPATPREGVDYRAQMARKFGAGLEALTARINDANIGTGIRFNFGAISVVPNTLNAHRLIYWSGADNKQHEVIEALFSAYFERGIDIGDSAVLLDIAESAELSCADIAPRLESDLDCDTIRHADARARDQGIGGVPAIVLGQAFVISGAQEPDRLIQLIRKASTRLVGSDTATF